MKLQPKKSFLHSKNLRKFKKLWRLLRCKIRNEDYLSQMNPPWKSFAQLIKQGHFTHVFLLPWLNPGGAERGALYYIQALVELGSKPFIILTENKPSTWLNKLPAGIEFISLGTQTEDWLQEDRIELLTRILIELKPHVIHNINSTLGWRTFKERSAELSKCSRLYCSAFADVIMPNGKIWSHARRDLPYCLENIKQVITDNVKYAKQLIAECAYPEQKFSTVYFPLMGAPRDLIDRSSSNKILWAGRLDREKRIDLLTSIAQKLPEFTFDVFWLQVI